MRKTKKEKVAATTRRLKELERFETNTISPSQDNNLKLKNNTNDQQIQYSIQNTSVISKHDKKEEILTNLSYLPKQLTKVGLTTVLLIFIQLILFFVIL